MKTEIETIHRTWYISDVDGTIRTTHEQFGGVIARADKKPIIYEIVRAKKSKAWGRDATHYCSTKSSDPETILYRAGMMLNYAELDRASEIHGRPADDFFGWSARFTVEHYRDKGFRGGSFQQFDGTYNRGCTSLDFTPATLEAVIKRFLRWCGPTFATHSVLLDGKTIKTFKRPHRAAGAEP